MAGSSVASHGTCCKLPSRPRPQRFSAADIIDAAIGIASVGEMRYEPETRADGGRRVGARSAAVRGTEEAFRRTVVDRLRTRTADLETLVRGMSVRGLSTQDVSALYHDTFGASPLSRTNWTRLRSRDTEFSR
jgi:hypothetical protein